MKELSSQQRELLNRLMENLRCQKDYKCLENGLKDLCNAKDIDLINYIECLESVDSVCSFKLKVKKCSYCDCPIRVYISKHESEFSEQLGEFDKK